MGHLFTLLEMFPFPYPEYYIYEEFWDDEEPTHDEISEIDKEAAADIESFDKVMCHCGQEFSILESLNWVNGDPECPNCKHLPGETYA